MILCAFTFKVIQIKTTENLGFYIFTGLLILICSVTTDLKKTFYDEWNSKRDSRNKDGKHMALVRRYPMEGTATEELNYEHDVPSGVT